MSSYNLLIIDPQKDFHEGGNLAVSGATADSTKISEFVKSSDKNINKIFVSLDTHTNSHIGHPGYWNVLKEDSSVDETAVIEPFTIFSIDGDKIIGSSNGVTRTFTPKKPELVEWTKKYIQELPSHGKGVPLIWPTHCLEDQDGHKVCDVLKTALDALDQSKVEYHIKGQNEASEMYSIFKAEIPVDEEITKDNYTKYYSGGFSNLKLTSKIDAPGTDVPDGIYLNTKFNDELYASLTQDGLSIVICGEALSHCVNWSLRDLVEKLKSDTTKTMYCNNGKIVDGKIILLKNASSPVPGFESNVSDLLKYCADNNVSIKYLNDGSIVDTDSNPWEGAPHLKGGRKSRR